MINPEFMMYRDGAEGCRTIDDFLQVVDELERGQYEELVDPNHDPEDQKPDAGGIQYDEPLDLRRSASELQRELRRASFTCCP